MKKLLGALIVLALIVGAGWYAYARWLRPPERRACERLAELCNSTDSAKVDQCEARLGKLADATGEQAFAETVACMERAETCLGATGCLAGGALRGLGQMLQGMGESLAPAVGRQADKVVDSVQQTAPVLKDQLQEAGRRALDKLE